MQNIKKAAGSIRRHLKQNMPNSRHLRELQLRLEKEESEKFIIAGFDIEKSKKRLLDGLKSIGIEQFSFEKNSIHWFLAAALSFQVKPKRILEIGTHTGRFTALLSYFFSESEIVTVDLPAGDPVFKSVYHAKDCKQLKELETKRRQFLSPLLNEKKVKFIEANSFFIPSLIDGTFDFIFVDAGHLYPEVAWDICNAYHLLNKPNGIMMLDDILPDAEMGESGLVSDAAFRMMQFLAERVEGMKSELYLKRHDAKLYRKNTTRKYVGLIRF